MIKALRLFSALRTKAFTWTPAPAAPDTGKGSPIHRLISSRFFCTFVDFSQPYGNAVDFYVGSSDQAMIPTGGEVAQFARAGEGLR